MGCGRSTLGSDSPKKNKKSEVDSECDSDCDSASSGGGGGAAARKHQQQLSNKLVPFGAGGPLLAQAKISDSQQDFFMMLDEKIENGPDYDSETEEQDRRRRLQQYLEQWAALTNTRLALGPATPSRRPPDEDTGSGDITEDEDEDEGTPGRIPDEAVREQYMFMGNLYTLTHIRTAADKTEPKVDVVTVPEPSQEDAAAQQGGDHKLNGSAVSEDAQKSTGNGLADGAAGMDGKIAAKTSPPPATRTSSRPASLILRSVFPVDGVQD